MEKHPLTIEKGILKKLANGIKTLKVVTRFGYEGMDKYEVQEQAICQQQLSSLKRLFRHRHLAYSLVRAGKTEVTIEEAKNTRIPIQKSLINKYMIQLLTAIAAAQSKHITRLVMEGQQPKVLGRRHNHGSEWVLLDICPVSGRTYPRRTIQEDESSTVQYDPVAVEAKRREMDGITWPKCAPDAGLFWPDGNIFERHEP